MVVFPLPVGPVTSIIPWGDSMALTNFISSSGGIPILSSGITFVLLNKRITILSPNFVGTVLNRTSTSIPPCSSSIIEIPPSCGNLCSEISQPAIIFKRVTTA